MNQYFQPHEMPGMRRTNNKVVTQETSVGGRFEATYIAVPDPIKTCAECPVSYLCLRQQGTLPDGTTIRRIALTHNEIQQQGANCQN